MRTEWQGFINVSFSPAEKVAFKSWLSARPDYQQLTGCLGQLLWLGKLSLSFDVYNDTYIAALTVQNERSGRPAGVTISARHSEVETAAALLVYYDFENFFVRDIEGGKLKKPKSP